MWPFSCMFLHMNLYITCKSKSLVADVALLRFVSIVFSLCVIAQMSWLNEFLVTNGTFIRLFSSMHSHMNIQGSYQRKFLITYTAFLCLFSSVDNWMYLYSRGVTKRFAANRTLVLRLVLSLNLIGWPATICSPGICIYLSLLFKDVLEEVALFNNLKKNNEIKVISIITEFEYSLHWPQPKSPLRPQTIQFLRNSRSLSPP